MAEVAKKQPELTPLPDARGHFGVFGWRLVAETLVVAREGLGLTWRRNWSGEDDAGRFDSDLARFVGRPSPLYVAENPTRNAGGATTEHKREDLKNAGACYINTTV